MATSHTDFDCELADMPPDMRWREWMRRIEAVLFASAAPVPREDLAKVVGQGASVDLLIDDLMADHAGRAFEIARVAGGWMMRTRGAYAPMIRAAPYTYVTTEKFLIAFDLQSLQDLPDRGELEDAGLGST